MEVLTSMETRLEYQNAINQPHELQRWVGLGFGRIIVCVYGVEYQLEENL